MAKGMAEKKDYWRFVVYLFRLAKSFEVRDEQTFCDFVCTDKIAALSLKKKLKIAESKRRGTGNKCAVLKVGLESSIQKRLANKWPLSLSMMT